MGILIIVVILGLAYFFLMLPARRRRTAHADMQDSVAVGDEVITAGGLHDETNTVQLEISPGVVVKLDRRAVAAVAREVEVEVEPPQTPAEAGEEPS
jgi:preprotein translocase subunit YajC